MIRIHNIVPLLTLLLLCTSPWMLQADEPWTQFRNQQGTGAYLQSQPPLQLTKETLLWSTDIPGQGWSSPVYEGDQVWVTTAMGGGISLRAVGVDLASGRLLHDVELFRQAAPIEIHNDNSYASPTPCIDQSRVYAHFGTFGTAAIDRKTGAIAWSTTEYQVDHQGGPGSSPVLFGDLLILTYDGADAQYVVALDSATGKEIWKRERSAPLRDNPITHRAFASPLLLTNQPVPTLISPAADQVHAYNARTGEELWHVRYIGFSNVPQPVVYDNLVMVCTGFYDTQMWAIEMGGGGDVTDTLIRWKYDKQASTIPTPLVVEDRVFHLSEGGILSVFNAADGKLLKRKRIRGSFSASPIATKNHLWLCSEEGKVIVLNRDDELEIVANSPMESPIKATPALLAESIVIRTESQLQRHQKP